MLGRDAGLSNTDARPLFPDLLRRDFGRRKRSTQSAVRLLYATATEPASCVSADLEHWKQLVDHACGRDVGRPSTAVGRMAEAYGLEASARPAELLFAVHSYYGLIVRLLLRQVVGARSVAPRGATCRTGELVGERELFDWPLYVGRESVENLVDQIAAGLARYAVPAGPASPAIDLFKPLYQDLVPRPVRHDLGEYYTPDWLAEHILDQVGYDGDVDCRLLDPACGSGTFLLAALRRVRRRPRAGEGDARTVLANIVGVDLNPVAVLSARANYRIALGDWIGADEKLEPPVLLGDSVLGDGAEPDGRFDVVVGNPPWIAWDCLPSAYREATKPLWQRYGLFSLSGADARHGGGKKDLAMLMLYAAADRYLRDGGRLGMVVTQTAFQTKGAGDGFRRFRLGDHGPPLRVLRVDDLADLEPFPGTANWTATIVLEKGRTTEYPVPYVKWSRQADRTGSTGASKSPGHARQECLARPVDPKQPGSPWLVLPEATGAVQRRMGPSDYEAHLGANTAGANGVFWVEILEKTAGGVLVRNIPGTGKRTAPAVEREVEPDLLYPLIRWGDVVRYSAVSRTALLLAQDVVTRRGIDAAIMQRRYPKTLEYLGQFEALLRQRAAYRRYQQHGPFWSMYNVGPYTLSPVKVIWRRMDRQIRAAVVESLDHPVLGPRPVVPQETCVLVSVSCLEEAHYLCAMLNSAAVDFVIRSSSVRGGKSFGTPGMLDYLGIERFNRHDPRHRQLADASRRAHQATREERTLDEIQAEIDQLAAETPNGEAG
ncbi:MAG: N-6 DNA methylase [Pirellulales bacterium]|nr:N-6 DNA methylase [Pirellulales bacterium]